MRIKMRDTTRHQSTGALLAGNVYEVDDETGQHLCRQRLAVKTSASVTDDTSLDEPEEGEEDGALDTPAPPARAITREDARALTGEAAPEEGAPARRARS